MARQHQSKGGKFTIKIPRGFTFSEHSLTTAGTERLKKAGVEINGLVPFYLLQLLDEHREVFPPTGAFKGQLQMMTAEFLLVVWSPKSKARQGKARNARPQLRVISVDWQQMTMEFTPRRKAA